MASSSAAMAAHNSSKGNYIYYYKTYSLDDDNKLGVIIQATKFDDGKIIIMDMFSSTWKKVPNDMLILPYISLLVKDVYKRELPVREMGTTNDISNPELQEVINIINPKVLLPFRIPIEHNGTIRFMRYFTRDLLETDLDPDNIGPETLVLTYKPGTNAIGPAGWTYYDPTSVNTLYGLNVPGKYTEITKEDFESISLRLTPREFPKITTVPDFEANFKVYLSGNLVSDGRYYSSDDIIEIINYRFAEHLDFSLLQKETDALPEPRDITSGDDTPAVSIFNYLPADMNDFFKAINFLRSYVDLYHDILEYGRIYSPFYLDKFKILNPGLAPYIDSEISNIHTRIFTKTGKINQNKCKEYVEDLTSVFINELHKRHIVNIPKTKENAFVMSASLDNKDEMDLLYEVLRKDGISRFFVESANNDIGVKLYSNGFKICNISIGDWDAGSGFSGKNIRPKPTIYNIGPPVLANAVIDMFGIININVGLDNNSLTISYPLVEPGSIAISPRDRLSVNKILYTTDRAIVRGTEDVASGQITSIPQITTASTPIQKASLISLKTWTDLIQIVSLSNIMSTATIPPNTNVGNKILTVIYDGLCETTSRLYGLGHVLKTEGKIVTYYSYNIHSRKLDRERRINKHKVKKYISENKSLFLNYLDLWFKQRINALQIINTNSFDPVLFFVSELFKVKYIEARTKALDSVSNIEHQDLLSIPDTIKEYIDSLSSSSVLLGDLQDSIAKFNLAIVRITDIGKRATMDTFLNAYDYVQQQIVNSFNERDQNQLRSMIATLFAYVYLQYPRDGVTIAFTSFESIKNQIAEVRAGMALANRQTRPILKRPNSFTLNRFRNEYLPSIKALPDTIKNTIRNISDIEIAIVALSQLTLSYNGAPILYQTYIKEIIQGPLYPLLQPFSFSSVFQNVESTLGTLISSSKYEGGKFKRNLKRTHKRKYKKRKTHKKHK